MKKKIKAFQGKNVQSTFQFCTYTCRKVLVGERNAYIQSVLFQFQNLDMIHNFIWSSEWHWLWVFMTVDPTLCLLLFEFHEAETAQQCGHQIKIQDILDKIHKNGPCRKNWVGWTYLPPHCKATKPSQLNIIHWLCLRLVLPRKELSTSLCGLLKRIIANHSTLGPSPPTFKF